MFFWTILASLLGIVMFGHWRENVKDQSEFVAPLYQAMALSTYQQHLAAEQAYQTTMSDPSEVDKSDANSAIRKLEDISTVNMMEDNNIFDSVDDFTPPHYKSPKNTRTYLFCLSKTDQTPANCYDGDEQTVKYLVTLRPVPAKYQGAAKMSVMRSIADATNGSRSIGLLMKYSDEDGLQAGGNVQYQPLGARYYILSGGTSEAGNVFVPNGIICNFPLNDEETTFLKDKLNQSDYNYIIALSMMGGFGDYKDIASNTHNLSPGGWPCD